MEKLEENGRKFQKILEKFQKLIQGLRSVSIAQKWDFGRKWRLGSQCRCGRLNGILLQN